MLQTTSLEFAYRPEDGRQSLDVARGGPVAQSVARCDAAEHIREFRFGASLNVGFTTSVAELVLLPETVGETGSLSFAR